MKTILLSLSLIFIFIGCATSPDDLSVKPVVKKTNYNYTAANFNEHFPDSVSMNSMKSEYRNNLNDVTRKEIIEYVKTKVNALGENENQIEAILTKAGCRNSSIIPTYVEKAKYNNADAWIIQFAWGITDSDLGHYKCYAINSNSLDTLMYLGCK